MMSFPEVDIMILRATEHKFTIRAEKRRVRRAESHSDRHSPEAGSDLTALIGQSSVLTGERQIPQIIQTNTRVISSHQDLQINQSTKINNQNKQHTNQLLAELPRTTESEHRQYKTLYEPQ